MSAKKSPDPARNEKYNAPALSKGLDILELLASRSSGMKKSEIAKALDRSLSEIFRMLAVLTQRDYVAFDPVSEQYSLTLKLFELAHRHPPVRRLTSIAGEVMNQLALDLNQSVHLVIRYGSEVLVIAQTDAPGNNITSVRLGARIPIIHTASGAILLSRMAKNERTEICNRSKVGTPDQVKAFEETVEMAAELGYCSSPSRVIAGVKNIAAPVIDYSGDIVAALTIPYVKRLTKDDDPSFEACIEAVIAASKHISLQLGAGAVEGFQ